MTHRYTPTALLAPCMFLLVNGVTLGQAPTFVVHPQGDTICAGATITFSIEVNFSAGSENPTLQWQFEGTDLNHGDRGGRVSIVMDLTDPSAATSTLTIIDTVPAVDAGSYRCVADTDNQGGAISSTAELLFHDAPATDPAVVFEGEFNGMCAGDTVGLTSQPSGSDPDNQLVIWSVESGPNTSSLQFSPNPGVHDPDFIPTDSGTYVLRAETFDCGALGSGTVTVEVYGSLLGSPTPEAGSTCVSVPLQMAANPSGGDGSYEFLWTVTPDDGSLFVPDEMAENPTFTPAVVPPPDGIYELSVVVSAPSAAGVVCSASAPGQATVTAESALQVTATTDEPEICFGDASEVTAEVTPANGEYVYGWEITAGPDDDPAQLSGTNTPTVVFTPSMTTAPEAPYELRVSVSGGLCDPGLDTIEITVNAPPGAAPSATPPSTCVGHPTALAANPAGSDSQGFLWRVDSGPDQSDDQFSPFPTAENPLFTPSTEGSYVLSVEVSDEFCEGTATETVEVEANAVLSADPTPAETTVCVDTPVTLAANPAGGGGEYTFAWSIATAPPGGESDLFTPDETAENPTFTPTATGTYGLEVVVDVEGCDPSDPGVVTIHSIDVLEVSASASDTEICLPGSTQVQADPDDAGLSYEWSVLSGPDLLSDQFGNPTSATTVFTPSTLGEYVLQVEVILEGGSCGTSSDTVAVTVYDTIVVEPSADPETVCLGQSDGEDNTSQLSVETGGSGPENQLFSWSIIRGPDEDDGQLSDPSIMNPVFTPSSTTSPGDEYVIEVEVFDAACGGALLTDEVIVTVNAAVTAAPSADPPIACQGLPVDLSANPAGGDGTYTFTWRVASGPTNPPSTFGDNDDDIHAENPTFTPAVGPSNYTLGLLIDDETCASEEPEYFVFLAVRGTLTVAPSAEFDPGVLGVPTLLHANAIGGVDPQFTWSVAALPLDCTSDDPIDDPSSPDPTFTAGCTGFYTLTLVAEDEVCADVAAGLDVEVIIFAAEPSAEPPSLCEFGSATLSPNVNAAFGPYDYLWTILSGPDLSPLQLDDPFAENPAFTPDEVGLYTIQVEATDVGNVLPTITGQFDIEVSSEGPTIDAPPDDLTVCAGEPATFTVTASGTDLTYQWRRDGADLDDETSSTLAIQNVRFSHAAAYTCEVSNGCGVLVSDVAMLTVDPPLERTLLAGARGDAMLRTVDVIGCVISADLLDGHDMGQGIERVTGLAVDSDTGVLYAAVRRMAPSPETELAIFDPLTGVATIVGSMGQPIGDLAFDATEGTLYAIRGNHPCPECPDPGFGSPGELFTVNVTNGALTLLSPPVVYGEEAGHSIAFDENGLLYHHSQVPEVSSRLTRKDLDIPGNEDVLRDYATDVEWTAMTIQGDLFLAARRTSPSELWSIDHAGGTYDPTVLGEFNSEGGEPITVMGLAFMCARLGDGDCDGDLDLDDFGAFDACVAVSPIPPECVIYDFDGDQGVGLLDWGVFQDRFTGAP